MSTGALAICSDILADPARVAAVIYALSRRCGFPGEA